MIQNDQQKKSQLKYTVAAFVSVTLFSIVYKNSLNQLNAGGLGDLVSHTAHAQSIYLDRLWAAWLKRPYLFWHLCVKACIKFFKMPVDASSAFVQGFFAGLCCLVTFYLLDHTIEKLTGKDAGILAALAAGVL